MTEQEQIRVLRDTLKQAAGYIPNIGFQDTISDALAATAAIQPAAETTEANRLVEELVKLHESKKPGGGMHGQVIGCEPYVIRASGFTLEVLLDAARFIQNAAAAPAQAATDEVREAARYRSIRAMVSRERLTLEKQRPERLDAAIDNIRSPADDSQPAVGGAA